MKIGFILIIAGITVTIFLLIIDILVRRGKLSKFVKPVDLSKAKKQLTIIQNMVIRKITSKKSEAERFEAIIEAIIYIATTALHAGVGSILLYNDDKKGLEIVACEGLSGQIKKETIIDNNSDDNIAWRVFENNEPLLIKNLKEKNKFKLLNDSIYKGNSLICIPIKTSEATMGVCIISDPLKKKPFSEENLGILISIAGQIAIVVDHEIYQQKLEMRMNELQTLYIVSEQVSHSLDLQTTLENITKLSISITNTDACSLRLLNTSTNELDLMAAEGLSQMYKQKGSLKIGEGVGGYVAREGVPVIVPDVKKDKRLKYTSYIEEEGLKSLVAVPIKDADEKVIGIISVYKKDEHEFSEEIVNLLSTFANNVSVAIGNARLFNTIKKNYYETIQALALAIEARDTYTNGHSERVTDLAVKIAKEMKLTEQEIETLRLACRLHDIGKIGIPDQILLKKGKLTPDEYADIKTHPVKGTELLKPLEFLENILPNIRYHHERYDGKGYPEGLSKKNIPILARILSVADAYDAMTSNRPYRDMLSDDEAFEELKKNSGLQFDPDIVTAFMHTINGNNLH